MTNRNFYINIGANARYSTFYTIGNIEIGEASGSLMNRNVTNEIFAHEVLRHFYTFMQVTMNPSFESKRFKKGLFNENEIKK